MAQLSDLPMDKICLFSDLPMATCSHCRGDDLEDLTSDWEENDFEIVGRVFETAFRSVCRVNDEHTVRKGDKVARLRHGDNPMLPVSGVACAACTKELPRARG